VERPRILITNDDGYRSAGITELATALAAIGDVTIVAPDDDRSGVGHQLSIKAPVKVAEVTGAPIRTFRCYGTPADCVVIGAFDLCGGRPALVVSGVNRGANLGDDINYSGTVAAAIEGTLIGIPSFSISLTAHWPDHSPVHHWSTATGVAVDMASWVFEHGLPEGTFLNINVPNVEREKLGELRWTHQGRKRYHDRLDPRVDPRGGKYYWIWGAYDPAQMREGTDLAAIRDGFVSVTPIAIDRTDEALLEKMRAEPLPAAR